MVERLTTERKVAGSIPGAVRLSYFEEKVKEENKEEILLISPIPPKEKKNSSSYTFDREAEL